MIRIKKNYLTHSGFDKALSHHVHQYGLSSHCESSYVLESLLYVRNPSHTHYNDMASPMCVSAYVL